MIGIGDIGSALLLLAIGIALTVLLVIGVALLVAHAVRRRRGGDDPPRRGLLVAGLVCCGIAAGVPIAGLAFANSTGQPDPLVFDLRDGMAEGELYGEDKPGFPGFYDFESGTVRLQLGDGHAGTTESKATVVTVSEGRVASVAISWIAEPPAAAARRARDWARQLDLDAQGIGDAANAPTREWSDATELDGMQATVSLQPVSEGSLMIPRVRIDLDDKGA